MDVETGVSTAKELYHFFVPPDVEYYQLYVTYDENGQPVLHHISELTQGEAPSSGFGGDMYIMIFAALALFLLLR